jgi:hypothetical protein
VNNSILACAFTHTFADKAGAVRNARRSGASQHSLRLLRGAAAAPARNT